MNQSELIEAHGRAVGLIKNRQYDPALRLLDKILVRHPEYAPAWQDRAGVLGILGAHFDAMLNWDRALALNPKEGGLYCNRGASLLDMSEFDLALADFEKGIEYRPNQAEIHCNMGIVYRRLCKHDLAIPALRKSVECAPDYSNAHIGLAMSLLEQKQFDEGWREFEWRWKHESMVPRGLAHPVWKGEPASSPDQALVLCAEQGNGDIIQFIRYAPAIKERWGGKVYAEVRLPLARLAENIAGIDKVILLGKQIPDEVITHICMLSVPAVVGTEKGFHGAYIKPDPVLVDYFGKLISATPDGFRVGVCWAGMNRDQNPMASAIDARRSLTLEQFAPLARIKGLTWLSLQKGAPAAQVKHPPQGMMIGDVTERFDDFWDTAALIANLDLVISVDSAVVHLAAAMGKPTWMLSRFDGCWRWFGDVPDSPWYPSLRQYRQKVDGDWTAPLDAMTRDLQRALVKWRQQAA